MIIILLLTAVLPAAASRFDELDKPPEGAFKGQMLLGGFVSIGIPVGGILDAEDAFLDGSTYTFSESNVTKKLMVNHLAFSLGANYEYLLFDHVGVRGKLNRSIIIQRTIFGSEYQNWSNVLYTNYSIIAGPAFHLTTRKQWDITLNPAVGYYIGSFRATPVASEILYYEDPPGTEHVGYSVDERKLNGFLFDVELNFTAYFSGGLYISLGLDWGVHLINFNEAYNLTNPATGEIYFEDQVSSNIRSYSFIISAGYAFMN